MEKALEDLQIRFAHQELSIEALSEALIRQDRVISSMQQELERLKLELHDLKQAPARDELPEPPPPHY